MKVVLDTNVLLISISTRSKFHSIFRSFLDEAFVLCISTEILIEYEEVLTRHMGITFATSILSVIEHAPNVHWITRYYAWNLIYADPDDNKFVDCAVASNARCIVTEDRHFDILNRITFPKVEVLGIEAFSKMI